MSEPNDATPTVHARERSGVRRAAITAVALRLLAGAIAGVVVVSAVSGRHWLGWRAWAIAVLGAMVLIALWRPAAGRGIAGWAAVWAAGGGLLAATALGHVARGAPLTPPEWWQAGDSEYVARMSDRILGRDLPSADVYAVAVAAVVLVVVCVVLALPWRERAGATGRGTLALGALVGVVVGALAVASTVTVAGLIRAGADRRAEAAVVTATVSRPAERLAASAGPARPSEIAWTFEPPRSDTSAEGFEGVAAVPGWDAVIAVMAHDPDTSDGRRRTTTRIVAFSKTDGSQLWQYWRHDGDIDGVAIDPETGRMLLLADFATVVLDLADGSRVAAASVPDPWTWADGRLVDTRFRALGFHDGAVITIGATAVSWDFFGGDSLTVFDVASGQVLGTTGAAGCSYAAATTASPVVVEWGCGTPHLLRLVGTELERTAVTAPDGFDRWLEDCGDCAAEDLIVSGDTVVVSVEARDDVPSDLVALSMDGEVLWRASRAAGARRGLHGDVDLVAITGDKVVAQWDDHWRVLSLTDGSERLRRRHDCSGDYATVAYSAVTDSDRIYAACDGRLIVYGIEDLALSWDEGPPLEGWDRAFPGDGIFVAVQGSGSWQLMWAIRDR